MSESNNAGIQASGRKFLERVGAELARHTERELGRIQGRKSQINSVNSNIPRKSQKEPAIQIARFS
jgi:hypothetical protein